MLKVSQGWVLKLLLAVPFNIGSFLYQPQTCVEKGVGADSLAHTSKDSWTVQHLDGS